MKKDILLSSLFSLIIFFVFLYILITHIPLIDNKIERINFGIYEIPKKVNFTIFNKELDFLEKNKTRIDNTLKKHFPLFSEIVIGSSIVEYKMNAFMYDGFENLRQKPVPLRNGRFLIDKQYIRNFRPFLNQDKVLNEIDRSAKAMNYVAGLFSNLKIIVFMLDEPWTKDLVHKNQVDYTREFLLHLNQNVTSYVMDENKNLIFNSDHHWNAFGSYIGYKEIHKIMDKLIPNFGELITPRKIYTLQDIQFQGSNARVAAMPFIYDDFYVMDFDLVDYDIFVNDEKVEKFNDNRSKYMNSEIDNLPFKDHYGIVYHENYAKIQYKFEVNKEKENILIFADSLSHSMDILLASHFYNTYVIDLRQYNHPFLVKEFIRENNITTVLFLGIANDILRMYAINDTDAEFNLR